MTREIEWTHAERERARAVLEGDARVENATTDAHRVTVDECSAWREELREHPGRSPRDLDARFSIATVENHVKGVCQHTIHESGIPVVYREGGWRPARVISAGCDPHSLACYHTRICQNFPESARVMPEGVVRQSWRECRECTGEVPEAKPVKRPGDD